MATNDTKTISKDELKLVVKGLEGLKGSLMRSKTKEASDEQMVEIYDGRIRAVDALISKVTNKELF